MPLIEDNQIAIFFTREEWECVRGCIQYAVHYSALSTEDASMEENIIDRIEKNLGIE